MRTADIREARNRALEDAAKAVLDSMWNLERDGTAHPAREHLKEAVAAIRAMKGKGDG